MRYHYTGKVLGQGTFSKVQEAMDIINVCPVAIKTWKLMEVRNEEVRFMTHVRDFQPTHPGYHHVLHVLDVVNDSAVMEKMDGTLKELLERYPRGLSESMLRDLIRQLCLGLSYIHACDLIHCDLKPTNIMYTFRKNVYTYKIGDFSNSLWTEDGIHRSDLSVVQTSFYRSFESVIFYKDLTRVCDLPSLACIVYEMATGVALFPFHDDEETVNLIVNNAHALSILCAIGLDELNRMAADDNTIYIPNSVRDCVHTLSAPGLLTLPPPFDGLVDLLKSWLCPFPDQRTSLTDSLVHPWMMATYTAL